jgi:hypothetical protein
MKRRAFLFILFASWSLSLWAQTELTGLVTKEAVLEKCPDWQPIAAAYNPNLEFIERLKSLTREVRIEVFLGSWCSDSKSHVSEFFKVLELIDSPLIQTSYISVPEDETKREPFYEGKDIQKIPTFIIFVDDLEKGRIIEVPKKSIEEDLVEIIEK